MWGRAWAQIEERERSVISKKVWSDGDGKELLAQIYFMDSQRNEQFCYDFVRLRDAVSSRWRGLACTSCTAKSIMISITRSSVNTNKFFSPGVTVSDGNVNNACVDLKKTFALKWQNTHDRCTLLGNKQADDRAGWVLLFPVNTFTNESPLLCSLLGTSWIQ